MSRWLLLSIVFVLVHRSSLPTHPSQLRADRFFEKKVRPILADHCYGCHGPKKQQGGLRLDTSAGLKAGADDGPVVVPATQRKAVC